jgi:hypothetical protein
LLIYGTGSRDADPPPPSVGTVGKNHLNEEITGTQFAIVYFEEKRIFQTPGEALALQRKNSAQHEMPLFFSSLRNKLALLNQYTMAQLNTNPIKTFNQSSKQDRDAKYCRLSQSSVPTSNLVYHCIGNILRIALSI